MSFTGKPESVLAIDLPNDGFFPAISLGELQRLYRVPAEYKADLVEHHTRLAMSDCNQTLAGKKSEWTTLGYSDLIAASVAEVNDDVTYALHYKRAVFCRAMGLLVLAFATLNRREQAENLAKESDNTEQSYFAQSSRSLRRLMGVTENVTVELL